MSKSLLRFGRTQRAAVRAACGIALGFTAPHGTRTEEVLVGLLDFEAVGAYGRVLLA